MKFWKRLRREKSPVRVLFTSSIATGAWHMRGEQLAEVYSNWRAVREPSVKDLERVDVVVGVKRLSAALVEKVKSAGVPLIYDVVDPWSQPERDREVKDLEASQSLFRRLVEPLKPNGYLYITEQMKSDLEPALGSGYLHRHHHDPSVKPQTLRSRLQKIGYDGDRRFLGEWDLVMNRLSQDLGFEWVPDGKFLKGLDLVFIGRGGAYNSFLSSRYKSNVKLANAMAAGVPALIQSGQAGCEETAPAEAKSFRDEASLRALIIELQSEETRRRIRDSYLENAARFRVEAVAAELSANLVNWKKT